MNIKGEKGEWNGTPFPFKSRPECLSPLNLPPFLSIQNRKGAKLIGKEERMGENRKSNRERRGAPISGAAGIPASDTNLI